MDYNEYYKYASSNFDKMRLDVDDEVNEHCSWFVNGRDALQRLILLDIGCGTGRYTQIFAKKGLLTIGVDKSPDQVIIASKRIPALTADALKLSLPKGSFDVISIIMMIQQLEKSDRHVLFSIICPILKNNGLLWVKTCSHADLERRPFNDFFPSAFEINVLRYPSIEDLLEIASCCGFVCLRRATKCNKYSLTGEELIMRFLEKHNTTLHMIPQEEYNRAIESMKRKYAKNQTYTFQHYHTLLEFKFSKSE